MKKISLFFFVFLLLSACVLSQTTSPLAEKGTEDTPLLTQISGATLASPAVTAVVEATPTAEASFEIIPNPTLTQIEMLDPLNGWGQAEGLVLRTEDGGETWLNVTPSDIFRDPAYATSFFPNKKTGWLLLEDTDKPSYGTIFRTTDGGATWLWRNTPFGRSYIGFFDTENGYALADLGAGAGSMGVAIWVTSNGGGDYNRVFLHEPGFDDSLPFGGIKNGIRFIDSKNGWVAGSQPKDGFIWLYRTRDGGFSWEFQALTLPPDYENAQTSADAPIFFEGGLGLLPVHLFGDELAMVFYQSIDSGETWTATQSIPIYGKYSLASANEIIVWDGFSTVYISSDSGRSWDTTITNWQPADTLRKIDFISATYGWALAESGLYRTEDGGQNWAQLGE